jgi:hypothetical protein
MQSRESQLSTDVYTTYGHSVAVLIKASLDAAMELDHLKNKAELDAEKTEEMQQIVNRCHAAIETLQTNNNLISPRFILSALSVAEQFMTGFEGDEAQAGIDEKLNLLRVAIGKVVLV